MLKMALRMPGLLIKLQHGKTFTGQNLTIYILKALIILSIPSLHFLYVNVFLDLFFDTHSCYSAFMSNPTVTNQKYVHSGEGMFFHKGNRF